MKRFIFLAVFCLTAILLPGKTLVASGDYSAPTNQEVLDSLVSSVSSDLIANILGHGIKALDISVEDNPAKNYIKQRIIMETYCRPLSFFDKVPGSERIPIEIIINECAVSFHNVSDQPDSLIRRAEVSISGSVRTLDRGWHPLPVFKTLYEDKVARDNVDALQNNSFPFLNPNVPDPELSFFEEFIEPIILVSSAVLTVVLLFSVRSN